MPCNNIQRLERLIKCGIPEQTALYLCEKILLNGSYMELEHFVKMNEEYKKYEEKHKANTQEAQRKKEAV